MTTAVPYWAGEDVTLYLGKCEDVLPGLPANSVDAIVTDPPAAVSFMNKSWDSDRGGRAAWVGWLAGCMAEAGRVLKPGGHLLVWSLPRTSHWTAWALEDAGLELKDCVVHLFGSGFPKSLNVSKAIDRAAGAQREVTGPGQWAGRESAADLGVMNDDAWEGGAARVVTAPATEEAARWSGFGTALKPGQEIWWLARKPLEASTVAANVLRWGTGALNVAGCRVDAGADYHELNVTQGGKDGGGFDVGSGDGSRRTKFSPAEGRWPSNVVFTHSASCEPAGTRRVKGHKGYPNGPGGKSYHYSSDRRDARPDAWAGHADADGLEEVAVWVCAPGCPVGELDRQSGSAPPSWRKGCGPTPDDRTAYGAMGAARPEFGYADSGGASRFYPVFRYQAKAPASERPRLEDGTAQKMLRLRADLTDEQRAYVMAELRKAGVDAA